MPSSASRHAATHETAETQHTMNRPELNHITSGNLTLRLAETPEELLAAQRLRYDVFYKELGAQPVGDMAELERDYSDYDDHCYHLIVVDNEQDDLVVGTYRIMMDDVANQVGIPFYTESEYDISKLRVTGGRIMEISRSCVRTSHRNKATINLLWKGIAQFVFGQKVDYLIGTASFEGTDVNAIETTLAYLNAYHPLDDTLAPRAHDPHYIPLPVVAKETLDAKREFMKLPPLIKGYLRVGALVGDGAFIDRPFNCVDVAIVMPIASITDRYFNHYKTDDAS